MNNSEMLADVAAYDAAKVRIERGEDEVIPFEITERRVAGESAVKAWREHRGLRRKGLRRLRGSPGQ